MTIRNFFLFALLGCLLLGLTSCNNEERFDTDDKVLNLDGNCQVYRLNIIHQGNWTVVSAPEWTTPIAYKGSAAQAVELYIESNSRDVRSGDVSISYPDGSTKTITIHQTRAEKDENPGLERMQAVGWGLDVTSYMDSRGITDQIFNLKKLEKIGKGVNVNNEHTAMDFNNYFSESTDSLMDQIGAKLNLKIKAKVFNLAVTGAFGMKESSNVNRCYAWSRGFIIHRKVSMNITPVSARSKDVFTYDFKIDYDKVIDSKGDDDAIIQNLIKHYGTHYVTEAKLGGYLDYFMSFVRTETTQDLNVQAAVSFAMQSKFAVNASGAVEDAYAATNNERIEKVLVRGGDAITYTNAIASGKATSADSNKWANSLNTTTDYELVDFKVYPIYDLFPAGIKEKIKKYIDTVMYYSDFTITRSEKDL